MKTFFLIRRLLRMTPAETVYRFRNLILHKIDNHTSYKQLSGGFVPPGSLSSWELSKPVQAELLQKADQIRGGYFQWFTLKDHQLPGVIDYHRDYKSGKTAPRDLPSTKIDYRDQDAIGDIKYIWEPNRHLFLPILAMAFHISNDTSYLKSMEDYLAQWLEQNPYNRGVNWASPLELGIRLINWTIVWALVGQHISPELVRAWEKSALQHADYIHRYYSRYSSANNHLIGEAAGLYTASVALLQGPRVDYWREKSKIILCHEILKQNFSDGVNREQAFSYQQFVIDFFLIAAGFGRLAEDHFPEDYWFQLDKMAEFVSAALSSLGESFNFGDDDDGLVIDFMQKNNPGICQSLLKTSSFLYQRRDLIIRCPFSERSDLKNEFFQYLYGQKISYRSLRQGIPSSFPEGGYYFLGRDFGTVKEEKLMFDCGQLGYLSIAAHGHSDALSFIFSAHGRLFFIDPGTYAYHGNKIWRDYFRSTVAHNTINIDSKNQSQIAGDFMWKRKANARCLEHIPLKMVSGEHDGYQSLDDPVTHKRTIRLGETGIWLIIDELNGRQAHHGQIMFHLHPDVLVTPAANNQFHLQRDGIKLLFEMDPALVCTVIRGQENPPLAWYSPAYDQKISCPVICSRFKFHGYHKLTCRFHLIHEEE